MNENDMFNLENNNGFDDKNNNNDFNMNNQGSNINYGSGQNYNQGNMQNTQYMNNNNYSNFNMNQNQTNGNLMNMNNMQNNMDIMNNNSMVSDDSIFNQMDEYKTHLRSLKEVQDLTSEVNVENPNSILQFGQRASEGISKVSDELLNSMKAVKTEEATEMLSSLTRIMDKFDVKELQNQDGKEGKISFFGKMFKKVQTSVADLFQKYDTMGIEVEKVYVILRKYEGEIRESNNRLKRLFDGNVEYYKLLEKYIVAGELAIEEIDNYINQYNLATNINEEEKRMMMQRLELSKEMLSQRVYDLRVAENVAIQAVPAIQNIQMSNFNLMRKINSSFIITLPIFKQCLAQAIILKRQEIQAKSIKQLDDKTNELLQRNAANAAAQSVRIAKMASSSSINIETLEKTYNTILKGIEETKAIEEANRIQRNENIGRLENIKKDLKGKIVI
ncbi:toxic anion resistance protein [Sarcina ventriculi]|uniref:toxic anion resistance protein n=1 Tax=Sarcina ventriculi TaxID=1267 RepID=UPI001C117B6B|nr:toxic anion resistance protein [Sarcina ventriculi]MBU5322349.1 toxic anion resistance protein [Sarcina ventriculi]